MVQERIKRLKSVATAVGICVMALVGSVSSVLAQLTFSPVAPERGQLVEFRYTDASSRFSGSNPVVVMYSFVEGEAMPDARQVSLQAQGGSGEYAGRIAIRMRTSYILLLVTDGKATDNNAGALWEIFPMTKDGKKAPYAYTYTGVSYLRGLPEEITRTNSADSALVYFDKALQENPNDIAAAVLRAEVMSSIGKMVAEEKQQVLTDIMQPFLQGRRRASNDIEIREVERALSGIGKGTEAKQLVDDYVQANPRTLFASDKAQTQIAEAQAQGGEAFAKAVSEYLNKFPSRADALNIQTYIVTQLLKEGDTATLSTFLSSLSYPLGETYLAAGMTIANANPANPRAAEYLERSTKLALNPVPQARPSAMAEAYFLERQKLIYRIAAQKLTELLENTERASEMGAIYRQLIAEGDPSLSGDFIRRAAAFYEKSNNNAEAYKTLSLAIRLDKADSAAKADHRRLYRAVFGTEKQYEEKLAAFVEEGNKQRRAALATELLQLPPIEGTFTDKDGKPIRLEDLKGKVVVIDYWATWCGPCKASFPALEESWKEYENDPEVAFLVVNVWERSEDRIATATGFLSQNTYTFPVYFDLKDEVIAKFGVTGIPTKFYLDKKGKVQFKEVGFNKDKADFVKKMRDKIEFLKNATI